MIFKIVILFIVITFSPMSFAAYPDYIESDTIEDICKKISCHNQLDEYYRKYYYQRQFHKALAISYYKSGNRYINDYFGMSYQYPDSFQAKSAALTDCKKHGRNCEILLVNNRFENKDLYLKLNKRIPSTSTKSSSNTTTSKPKIPFNAHAVGDSWVCGVDYYKSGNACRIVPVNASSSFSSNFFYCDSGYSKSGNTCIRNQVSASNTSKKTSSNQSSPIIGLFFDESPTILFWLALIFLIYLFRPKSTPEPKRKKIVVTKDTPKPYPNNVVNSVKKTPPSPVKVKKTIITEKPLKKTPPARVKIKKTIITEKPLKKTPPARVKIKKTVIKEKPLKKTPPKPKSKVRVEKTSLGFNVLHFEQGSEEWLEWRHTGIGASDASTVMGDNRFESAEELLYAKKNRIVEAPNDAMKEGTRLEPIARNLYINETGIKVIPLCLQDKKYSWIIASMDGITKDFTHIVEIKCGKSAYWQARKRTGPPDYYYGQLQHQMMITGLKEVDYYCYWPGETSVLQVVKRDENYIKSMFRAEQAFMRRLNE
jgi:putative phage-type endonuclease